MKKVLITDNTHPILQHLLQEAGIGVDVVTNVDYATLMTMAHSYDGLVVRSKVMIDKPFIEQNRHLKCIARVGAGMETIDVPFAEANGIHCINSPEGNRDAVGEHAVGLLLSLFDKISSADAEIRKGFWHRESNRGLEIKGKTIGIIGFGNMGSAFAQRLQGFECKILSYDKYKTNYVPSYVHEVSLAELQREADVISLHVPLTNETHYMVDKAFLDAFAKPIYLINTSRGAVVKTTDLVEAMKLDKVAGVALDVIEYENMAKDGLDAESIPEDYRYLLLSSRTVLTPHVAGWTVESKYKLATVLAQKIIACLL